MPKLRNLKKRISVLRQRLHVMVDAYGTFHPAVIAQSAKLDEALNVYYRVRQVPLGRPESWRAAEEIQKG